MTGHHNHTTTPSHSLDVRGTVNIFFTAPADMHAWPGISAQWNGRYVSGQATCGDGAPRLHCTAGSGSARGRSPPPLHCGGGTGHRTARRRRRRRPSGVTSRWRCWAGSCCSRTRVGSCVRTSGTTLQTGTRTNVHIAGCSSYCGPTRFTNCTRCADQIVPVLIKFKFQMHVK
jgi:hypothetical protein